MSKPFPNVPLNPPPQEKSLPGVILSRQKAVFDRLEDLCQMSSSSIIFRVRSLLMLIPTDPRPVENMEIFTHTTPQGASEDPQSPASPHTVLRDYFDPAKTTPTRLLYSLEILSSRLIPAGDREVDEGQPQLFRRNFLECGGLKSVINVLQRNALPSDVDLTVRQDCYAIALALARLAGLQLYLIIYILRSLSRFAAAHTPFSFSRQGSSYWIKFSLSLTHCAGSYCVTRPPCPQLRGSRITNSPSPSPPSRGRGLRVAPAGGETQGLQRAGPNQCLPRQRAIGQR